MATNLKNERSPIARLFLAFEFDAMVKAHAERAGSKVTDVLNEAVARQQGAVNSANRRGKRGRKPGNETNIICGMDPVDALMLQIIMVRLGHDWPKAAYDQLIEKHALKGGDAALRGVTIEKKLKSLRERQPADIRIRFEQAKAALPLDHAGLTRALQELIDRTGLLPT